MAEEAYRAMQRDGEAESNQSIIVSGESGAGKVGYSFIFVVAYQISNWSIFHGDATKLY